MNTGLRKNLTFLQVEKEAVHGEVQFKSMLEHIYRERERERERETERENNEEKHDLESKCMV